MTDVLTAAIARIDAGDAAGARALLQRALSSPEIATQPLDAYRAQRLLSKRAFAALLGVTEQTYRRVLATPERTRLELRQRICQVLGVSPYHINEFYPAQPGLMTQVRAAVERADRDGWAEFDLDTGEFRAG